MRDHKKLRAFELSDEVVVFVYSITKCFPKEEIFGLTSQMRRSAVSIPSNIVEGCARESQVEYHRFLEIAFGSLKELHYQFELAFKLGYVNENDEKTGNEKLTETSKVLGALLRAMRK